jgi:hypothetical protein
VLVTFYSDHRAIAGPDVSRRQAMARPPRPLYREDMTEGSDYGWNARGLRFGDQGASAAPDFARNDRGDVDDHWSRAVGQERGKCAVELTSRDFVRRRLDGTWVHEDCPGGVSAQDGIARPDADGARTTTDE